MRRFATVTALAVLATVTALAVLATVIVGSPALAFLHNGVRNPGLHAVLDLLTLAVVSAPILTASLWRGHVPHRGVKQGLLALLIALQLPAAVLAFTTFMSPYAHAAANAVSLALTGLSLWLARRSVPLRERRGPLSERA